MNKKQERLAALERQVQRINRRLAYLERRSNQYSWVRLTIFIAGLIASLLFFFLLNWWIGLISESFTLLLFAIAVTFHQRIERSIVRHKIWRHIKATHIARIQLNWRQIPSVANEPPHAEHPFEIDLDITGQRSLYQLISTATSSGGGQRLREWLLQPRPDLAVIRERQALVKELALMSRFRDKLTLKSLIASKNITEQAEGKLLLDWLQKHESRISLPVTLWVAVGFSLLTLALFLLNMSGLITSQLWSIAILISLGWFFSRRQAIGDLFDDAAYLSDRFARLSSIFAYLEKYPYGAHTHLKSLCKPFHSNQAQTPSYLLKRLARIASAASLQKNRIFWIIINALIPWDFYFAWRFHQAKKAIAASLPTWLDTWFEIEAICSLATFAYLNPNYTLPEIYIEQLQASTELFQACDLGHPLLMEEKKVVNNFAIDKLGEIRIITGSNMSGKSTFLRTFGINLCLAFAGGPVNASHFQTAPFRIFTCIKVSDSVSDGYSYFYAEVKRLKALLDKLNEDNNYPLFFLIDEIFKGTNNRERLLGSRAYIQSLIGKNCVGVISTHDLELVKLAETFTQIQNYHFREEVIDGTMIFDYVLRHGPCPTTNALKIMQLEGLPIESALIDQ